MDDRASGIRSAAARMFSYLHQIQRDTDQTKLNKIIQITIKMKSRFARIKK